MQFVANIKFQGNDKEFERLYNKYKKAKGNLQEYLMNEGIDFGGLEFERKKKDHKRQLQSLMSNYKHLNFS